MVLIIGQTYNIQRTIFDVDQVSIELSRNYGATYELITSAVDINHLTVGDLEVYDNLNYEWTVTGPESDSCIFRISGTGDTIDIVDLSNEPFGIWKSPIRNTDFSTNTLDIARYYPKGITTYWNKYW